MNENLLGKHCFSSYSVSKDDRCKLIYFCHLNFQLIPEVVLADQQQENVKLSERISLQRAEIDALKLRLAELEGQSNSASGDDKYSLTKAKLVRLMKENGWYD